VTPDDIDEVLDLARTETAPDDESPLGFLHVALGVARFRPGQVEKEFGAGAVAALRRLLAARVDHKGDLATARALLALAPDAVSALHALLAALEVSDLGSNEATDDAPDHESWLVDHIDRRFAKMSEQPTSLTLDELYVLIGTLKIVGYSQAHEAAKKRLMALRETPPPRPAPATSAPPKRDVNPTNLREMLKGVVRGQDRAVERIADRLAITRTGLDLRPERPNGVFLFAGPTGVGKTELARQIAIAEYGGSDHLLRLDMSEYGEYAFGLARLVGSAPGYAGHSDPESWLTTRVRANPHSVILLDEIEKAHPAVWNTFLQVFDSGTLTDGRGQTASFADAIIVMTSNLGAREASASPVGFGDRTEAGSIRQLAVLKEQLAPELINRIDEIILFDPLPLDAIQEIAVAELAAAVARISTLGWTIEYDGSVPHWIAHTDYDPTYGARHLHRNIERRFIGLLTRSDGRSLRIVVEDDDLVALPL
jgi:hypothetical protein